MQQKNRTTTGIWHKYFVRNTKHTSSLCKIFNYLGSYPSVCSDCCSTDCKSSIRSIFHRNGMTFVRINRPVLLNTIFHTSKHTPIHRISLLHNGLLNSHDVWPQPTKPIFSFRCSHASVFFWQVVSSDSILILYYQRKENIKKTVKDKVKPISRD